MKTGQREKTLLQNALGSFFFVSVLAILDVRNIAIDKGFSLTQTKWFVLIAGLTVTGLLSGLLLINTKAFAKTQASLDAFLRYGAKIKWLLAAAFLGLLFVLPALVMQPYLGDLLQGRLWLKFFVFLLVSVTGAMALRAAFALSWMESMATAALGQLLVYQLAMASLYITDYPFALGWSRASRYYYASLPFAEQLYGQKLPLSILHPALHFLYGLPFLLGKMPLWAHRAWTVILSVGLTFAVAAALLRRIKIENRLRFWTALIWAYLFLMQGSIYTHLLVPTLLIFLFVAPERKTRSWLVIIIASLWAGISRINWFPVPAMLAALIYLLEVKISPKKSMLAYLALPAAWFVIGSLSAFLGQAAYINLSGNGARGDFFTSLSSDLLWFRLLPNATYAPGILGGALLASAPLLLLLGWYFHAHKRAWRPVRLWGIACILLTLFVGGLVVSVKIGGGADLHNLDAYWVSLLLVTTTVLARGFQPDSVLDDPPAAIPLSLLVLGVLTLAWFLLPRGGRPLRYDRDLVQSRLNDLQAEVADVASAGGGNRFI
ncbi:MAG: hypothetical protein L3J16_03080, partial [Anaerolineales bacterium]|nr:hypothetical protein [Anaerolineales bacterium]